MSLPTIRAFLHCILSPSRMCRQLQPLARCQHGLYPRPANGQQHANYTHLASYSLQSLTVCISAFPISTSAPPRTILSISGRFPSMMRERIEAYEHSLQSALGQSQHFACFRFPWLDTQSAGMRNT